MYISSLDLKDAYWQIPLDINSRDKTAFTIPGKPLYQYKVMPFGLTNASQTMTRLMDKVIPPELRNEVFVYLDDLLVVSDTFETHMKVLDAVADQIKAAGLTLNVEKRKFCMRSVKYLGHIVGEGIIRTDPEKISAMADFPLPKSLRSLRSFLGMVGWYRKFISNFASVAAPLTDLLKPGKKFQMTPEGEKVFVSLKEMLCSAPVLRSPDFTRPFYVQCDASKSGVGGVLVQKLASLGFETQGFNFKIEHRSGKMNVVSDALSRVNEEETAAIDAMQGLLIPRNSSQKNMWNWLSGGSIGIFIVLDHYSKFVFLKAVKKLTADVVIKYLQQDLFHTFGVPEILVSDNGSQFMAEAFQKLLREHSISHTLTAAYSPQANASERVNRSVIAAIRSYVRADQKDWDEHLSSICCALQTAVHSATGTSPYYMTFGQNFVSSGALYKLLRTLGLLEDRSAVFSREDSLELIRKSACDVLKRQKEKNERQYNLRSREVAYQEGQEVFFKNFRQRNLASGYSSKLGPAYLKARVRKKLGNSCYELKDLQGRILGRFHAKDMKQ
ncbi:uncharacterized protein LOC122320091 [Drosophila ficusphila]|uniref:uncharacterized protein LOC122320091 n=1 Tax=Drosophila ficusphila TaxID=30025 RepID=UPI001C89D0A5|nr:uncharacterized protein LOC122320091 [Drosophila ficusphila]